MLEIDTTEAVKKFVKTFQVVKLRHLRYFFRDRGDETLEHSLKLLMEHNILHDHGNDCYSLAYPGKLPGPLHGYEGTWRCLDMMARTLSSSEVMWFDMVDYPLNIRFLTVAEEMYDVAYVDERNWVHKYPLFSYAWSKGLPQGQEDPVNHIAVVPNLDVAQQVRDLAFSQFIVVDHNGAVLGIYDND